MTNDTPLTAASPECSRSAARCAQILDAAAHCFRAYGFHGTSIARISQQAGMSAGHIYHYFENKEAIIAAIVQRDLENLIEIWAELRASRNVPETMVKCSANGVNNKLDPSIAGLRLEIVAEAARNPKVAGIVRAADHCCMASLIETLRVARQARGKNDDDEVALAATAEVLAAIFEGLMVRRIRNPDIDPQRTAITVQRLLRQIIDSPDWNDAQ